MTRLLFPRSVRGRLLVVVAIVVGGALAAMIVGFNLLLARSLDGDATRLARSRASAVLSTLHVQNMHVVVSEAPDDASIDSQSWIFEGTRVVEGPPTTLAAARAARLLALSLSERGTLDIGDLRLAGVPIAEGRTRIGAVVAGVSLEPYEQTRRTALALSSRARGAVVRRRPAGGALAALARASPGRRHDQRGCRVGRRGVGETLRPRAPARRADQLAATLDSLLDRLAASLRHERLFSAELSHELRTPLARILAQSEMMLTRAASDYRDSLERIRASATQMTRTVETLVSEARLQASGPRGSCELAGVLATVVGASRESARQHGCRIELDPTPPGLRVGASADLVERIVHPIVENACSYGSSTVQISLVRRGASRIQVRISDDGSGIVDDERERIFEPGVRGRAGNANERGAGLGLALARRLATSAGATIEAPRSSNGGLVVVELPTA